MRPLLLILFAILLGCDREEGIRTYSVAKDIVSTKETRAVEETDPPVAPPQANWALPAGWKLLAARSMRVADFGLEDSDAKVEFYISVFGPEAGELLANVNRWEGQIKLPPTNADNLPSRLRTLSTPAGEWATVELLGPESEKPRLALLGGLLKRPDKTWFVKMIGPADLVQSRKADFEALVKSISFEAPTTSVAPPGSGIPSTWLKQPPKQMRLDSYWLDDEKTTEVVVSRFGANAFGDELSNINRWRKMAELDPIADASSVQKQPIDGGNVYDFAGTSRRIRIALLPVDDQIYFVRLTGPKDKVAKAQNDFDAYLKSKKWQQ